MKKKWRNTQELLQMIAEMYVFVGRADKEKVPCAHEIAIAWCRIHFEHREHLFKSPAESWHSSGLCVHCVQEAISSNTKSPQLWLIEEQKSKHHILMHFACLIATLGQHLNPILMIPSCLSLWFVHSYNEEIFIRILQCHGWIKSYTLPQSWKSLPTVLDTNPFS